MTDDDPLEEKLNALLGNAIFVAVNAYDRQLDKGGKPYILHPITVMQAVDTTEEKIIGILHDVIEDTRLELDDFDDYPIHLQEALDAITKRKGEKYKDYLARVKADPIATNVKLADIAHNAQEQRLDVLEKSEREYLISKYSEALAFLFS